MPKYTMYQDISGPMLAKRKAFANADIVDGASDATGEEYRAYKGLFPIVKPIGHLIHCVAEMNGVGYDASIETLGRDENVLLWYKPRVYLDGYWCEIWHGAVYQFGRDRLKKTHERIQVKLSGRKSFVVRSTKGILASEVTISVDGLGFFMNDKNDVGKLPF